MVISELQKALIIDYLGYPAQSWVLTWVNQRIQLLPSAETEDQISQLISDIESIENTKLNFTTSNAGKQVDGINRDSWYQNQPQSDYNKLINNYKRRISVLLSIPINNESNYGNLRGRASLL